MSVPTQTHRRDRSSAGHSVRTADGSDLGSDLDSAPSVGFHFYNSGRSRFDGRPSAVARVVSSTGKLPRCLSITTLLVSRRVPASPMGPLSPHP